MTYPEAIKAKIAAASGITALVGDRVWPIKRDSAVLPAITYLVISGSPENSLDGFSSALWKYRTQIDVWARKFVDANALASLVLAQLNTTTPGTSSGLQSATLNFQQDFYEDDTKIYRVMMDFNCRYRD